MSLFADKQPAGFARSPFGFDSVRSTIFDDFCLGSGSTLLGSDSLDSIGTARPSLRNRNTSLLTNDRFHYDQFDSLFRDFPSSGFENRRHIGVGDNSDPGRRSPLEKSKGKEFIIPIKIETSSGYVTLPLPNETERQTSCQEYFLKDTDSQSSSLDLTENDTRSTTATVDRFAKQPLQRDRGSSKEKSHSPVIAVTTNSSKSPESPSQLSVLSPANTENCPPSKTSEVDLVLSSRFLSPLSKSDASFLTSKNSPRSRRREFRSDADNIVKIEEEIQEETTITSLRRRPIRSQTNKVSNTTLQLSQPHSNTSGGEIVESKDNRTSSLSKNDVGVSDVKDKIFEREPSEREDWKQPVCGAAGVTDITPTPSYPVYDHLKPRLASTGRQVDYIRGDGNCFFRALSKEMYGSENYHAEWREAVCDVIHSHPNTFAQYVDGGSVSRHVSDMRAPGTWATTCEIYAAASLLRREVYVLAPSPSPSPSSSSGPGSPATGQEEYHWLLFSPRALPGSGAGASRGKAKEAEVEEGGCEDEVHPCYITLCHTNGNHYDRITPVYARCNCQIPPPSLDGVSVMMDLTASDEEELMQKE